MQLFLQLCAALSSLLPTEMAILGWLLGFNVGVRSSDDYRRGDVVTPAGKICRCLVTYELLC